MLFASIFFLVGCGQNADITEVKSSRPGNTGGGGGNPQQKPSGSPTPYDISQFQQGQWILWSRKSSSGSMECVRWTWTKTGVAVNTHTIAGDYSPDCQNWPRDVVRTLKFSPKTGKVEIDRLDIDGSLVNTPNGLTSIYDHLYGSSDKLEFTETIWSLSGKRKLPVFSVKGKNQFFLNSAGHAFHGVVLRWNESEDSLNWTYQFVDSQPPLPFMN